MRRQFGVVFVVMFICLIFCMGVAWGEEEDRLVDIEKAITGNVPMEDNGAGVAEGTGSQETLVTQPVPGIPIDFDDRHRDEAPSPGAEKTKHQAGEVKPGDEGVRVDSGISGGPTGRPDSFDSIEALIDILKAKGVINADEAEKFISRYRGQDLPVERKTPVITIVPEDSADVYVEEITRQATEEIRKDVKGVKGDLDEATDELLRRSRVTERRLDDLEERVTSDLGGQLRKLKWAQKIRWGGDVRIRYHGETYDNDNASTGMVYDWSEINDSGNIAQENVNKNRHRMRYRVRLGMKAKINAGRETDKGEVEFGFRLTTSNEENPVSNNDTMGDYKTGDGLVVDRAYLKWAYRPEEPIWGRIPEISLTAGRMPNPWFYTNLVWDHDLNFEGIAFNLKTDTQLKNPWSSFLTLGAFPLQEVELESKDKWLYGAQVGVGYRKAMGLSWKLGAAYYYYDNITGIQNEFTGDTRYDYTAPLFVQQGNTLYQISDSLDPSLLYGLVSEFHELNVTAMLDFDYWFPVHVILWGDYVKNLGFDSDDVAERLGGVDIEEQTEGYHLRLSVGYPEIREFGEWNCFASYKHLERDAVVDAFTDSDMHLGGTNFKGWILGYELGLFKNVWLKARWFSSDDIDLLYGQGPISKDIIMFDVNARY